jgi:hypothetical protein
VDSSDSSLPQITDSLGMDEYLLCTGLGPGELCYKEIMEDGCLVLVVDWS